MSIYLPIAEMNVNILLIILLGIMVGGLTGLFGVGGGFLMTPLLIFLGIPSSCSCWHRSSTCISLIMFQELLRIGEEKNVDIKMGIFLLAGGIAGSVVGVNLFKILREFGQIDVIIQFLFLIFLGLIGFSMLFESARTTIKKYRNNFIN